MKTINIILVLVWITFCTLAGDITNSVPPVRDVDEFMKTHIVTLEQFQKIHVGMTQDEGGKILGEPLSGAAEESNATRDDKYCFSVWVAPNDSHGRQVRLMV